MKKRCAFTLVELVVVLLVIALLILFLMVTPAIARYQAKKILCMANLHQWGLASSAYAEDYDGWLPDVPSPANNNIWDVAREFIAYHPTYPLMYRPTPGPVYSTDDKSNLNPCIMRDYGINSNEFLWCPLTSSESINYMTGTEAGGYRNGIFNFWHPIISMSAGYFWWVPRTLDPGPGIYPDVLTFPWRESDPLLRDVPFVRRASDHSANRSPIMTDVILRQSGQNNLLDNPEISDNLRDIVVGILGPNAAYSAHNSKGKVSETHLLFADTHVEPHLPSEIRNHHRSNYANLY